jgi:hypothetical protein
MNDIYDDRAKEIAHRCFPSYDTNGKFPEWGSFLAELLREWFPGKWLPVPVAESVRELLLKLRNTYEGYHLTTENEAAALIQSYMNSQAEKWIPVTKYGKMPDHDALVLVSCSIGVELVVYNEIDECWDDSEGDDYYKDLDYFTHWQPIPAPPKGDE